MDTISPYTIDSLFAASHIGSLDKALTNNVRGIDPTLSNTLVLPNKDHQGYLFMTRPQLNLQKDNIRNHAPFYFLLNEDPNGLPLMIRSILDPRIGAGYSYKKGDGSRGYIPPVKSNLFDNLSAFIPFTTNNIITSSGWGDKVLPTGSTDKGIYNQSFILIDGVSRDYGEWDLSIAIQNMKGDYSISTMSTWIDYISLCKEELMIPYFDYVINDRQDFNTRAYRIVLDSNKEYVTKFGVCIAGLPTSVPYGMFGDFDNKVPFSEQTKELTYRFRCIAQIWNDPRYIMAFNKVVICFNPGMADNYRDEYMERIPRSKLNMFIGYVYPRIDLRTLRFEWYTFKNHYNEVLYDGKNPSSFAESPNLGIRT